MKFYLVTFVHEDFYVTRNIRAQNPAHAVTLARNEIYANNKEAVSEVRDCMEKANKIISEEV